MRHICKYITGIFLGAMLCETTVNAAEIINTDAVMYTNAETVIYAEADLSGEIVLTYVDSNLPVKVIGITDNGFFKIDINGVYYVPGNGLSAHAVEEASVNDNVGNDDSIFKAVQERIEEIDKLIELVNQERQKAGLAPVVYDEQMTYAATQRSSEMCYTGIFSHTRPNGARCFTVFDEYNITYQGAAENIAAGHTSAEHVMSDWMNSPGHKSNILKNYYTKIGVGIVENSSGYIYWTQLFAV